MAPFLERINYLFKVQNTARGQKRKDRPHDIQFKYKRLEIIICYAFFQTVDRIAKMNSVAFDSGAFHPEMVAIACIRDVNRQ